MFYRQKVLLAMLQCFQGDLGNTDLEKLLFLYCKKVGHNYYDFFPYKFGAFSFTSFEDRRKLIEKGLLKDVSTFKLNAKKSFVEELELKDRAAMRSFARQFSNIRGDELIRMSYLKYPEYAARSEIASDVLTAEEYSIAKKDWNTDRSTALFTIGYEGISIDEYLFRLLSNNVQVLVDVRINPFSRKHGFSQKRLQSYVERVGIIYQHMPELGVPSHMRKSLDSEKAYADLFEYYASEILSKQSESLEKVKRLLRQHNRVALTCFEADHQLCHRHEISTTIQKDSELSVPVIHISF